MMQRATVLATMILCLSFFLLNSADAAPRHHYRHHYRHHWSHHLRVRHAYPQFATRHSVSVLPGLPAPCRVAAAMGGPCGCWAAWVLLGRLDHVWRGINLWLANDWLRFPRAAPAPGTAAVWPGRHVAPVVAVKGSTVIVRDSWATHPVRMAGLVFVQPIGVLHRTGWKFDGAVPL